MSLSLSSLLNPSPDSESAPAPPPPPAPAPSRRKDSLPPIQYVQSPDQQYTQSPLVSQSPQQWSGNSWPPAATAHEAAEALTALAQPPPPIQTQWYGQSAPPPPPSLSYERRSSSYEQRPGSSGYGESIQLPPPPPPSSATARKPSSPTLDQYHVASRSPEQRRSWTIPPVEAGLTLPRIHSLVSPSQSEQIAPPRLAHESSSGIYQDSASDSRAVATSNVMAIDSMAGPTQEQTSHDGMDAQSLVTKRYSPPAQIHASEPVAVARDSNSSPAAIKQEHSPRPSSPIESQKVDPQTSDVETQDMRAVASLKTDHPLFTNSPLRESSVPVPSTETTAPEPSLPNPKKRPAPAKTKKGMATATKKAPAPKKRRVEPKRSVTPSSTSKASRNFAFLTGSSKGTPLNSSPAPSTLTQSDSHYEDAASNDDDDDEDMDSGSADPDGDVYCICRKPDNGTFMIGCDGTCDDWFHGKCVGIQERDKNLIDKYVCPNCTKAGAGKTTWKRICRRRGCRLAARVGKTKGGKDGSKYCSEECGVLYFREMVARTRGREDGAKQRGSRRESANFSAARVQAPVDYDLGARGGVLAAGELKSLVNSSSTADEFKKLGEGVLSPPATPPSTSPTGTSKPQTNQDSNDFTESEASALQGIRRQKQEAREKHALLKDRMKFVTLAKQAATRTAVEKDLKPKDFCGYDNRLEWSDEEFASWRSTRSGRRAFELDTLAAADKEDVDMDDAGDEEVKGPGGVEVAICDRKKCARHLEWSKLAVDDVRFEIADNSDRMRGLEKEEREVRERAALRAKGKGVLEGEGRVEVHGLGILGLEGLRGDMEEV